jgi:hypothetical protein
LRLLAFGVVVALAVELACGRCSKVPRFLEVPRFLGNYLPRNPGNSSSENCGSRAPLAAVVAPLLRWLPLGSVQFGHRALLLAIAAAIVFVLGARRSRSRSR